MQLFSTIILLFCASIAPQLSNAVALTTADHPIEKVITMLKDLTEKVNAEAKTEEVSYTKFVHWCTNSKKTLEASIAEASTEIDALKSEIAAGEARADVLSKEMSSLSTEMQDIEASAAAAKAQRDNTAELDSMAQADYDSTIAAIKEALAELEKTEVATDGFLQRMQKVLALVSTSITDAQQNALAGFVQERQSQMHMGNPDVAAKGDYEAHIKDYAFKSNSVIELLKGLLSKFEEEKLAAVKAETNSLNAYSLAEDARINAKTAAQASFDAKTEEKGSVETKLGEDKALLEETTSDMNADSATLSASEKQCAVKASEWAERSDIRTKELAAMKSAIDILAKVTGVRTEAPGNPIPPASPVSLIQNVDPRSQVVNLLRKEAHESHSRALERLAQEIAVHRDSPFAAVNNMIQKMIFRLMDEQKDEDNHKNWCDTELDKTNTSKVDKTEKAALLTAKIEADTATVQVLTEDIGKNAEMIATIESHMAESEEIRSTGKKENAISLKDSQDAQTALAEAVAVLESFYKESGAMKKEAWEFMQQPVELGENPATWEASYKSVEDPNAGIIALLKSVSAEFAKMESDTTAQEEMDQTAFEEDMKLCKIEKSRREKESEMKDQEKKRLLDKVSSLTKSHKEVSKELEAVEQYLKDLEPACVTGDSTYEARKADRAKEMDALKEAQGILAEAFSNSTSSAAASSAAFLSPVRRVKQ